MTHLGKTDLLCDDCPTKHWITDKEYLYSQADGLPIILECHHDGERIVRGTPACIKHPKYACRTTAHTPNRRR